MEAFTNLFIELDTTTKTLVKRAALSGYFSTATPEDILWAVWLLSGNTVKRSVSSTQLKEWATDAASIPRWLFDECYIRVGDLAETVSLVITQSDTTGNAMSLSQWMEHIVEMKSVQEPMKKQLITRAWRSLSQPQRFIFTKLITGSFRVGVSRGLTVKALAQTTGDDPAYLMHQLMGDWNPAKTTLAELTAATGTDLRPYPFYLASPVDQADQLGLPSEWQAEWKRDGIRGQIVCRGGLVTLWSRGEEIVSEQFPEIMNAALKLPEGTVLDGEIMPWKDGPLSFAILQTRLGRKSITAALQESAPVAFIAYDQLEHHGIDVREQPLAQRRKILEDTIALFSAPHLQLSPVLPTGSWKVWSHTQSVARDHKAEGLMLKRLSSPYKAGRVRGDWWKWKVDPLSVDAVMINAQRGHGRRADVYSDYTFALRDGEALVPFAKAYSGLTDAEIRKVDAFVKRHTVEKFGPVRTVTPELVFEIGFEGISLSKRHKSGLAVRFPRILRWREDKTVQQIDTLESLKDLHRSIQ